MLFHITEITYSGLFCVPGYCNLVMAFVAKLVLIKETEIWHQNVWHQD